MMGTGARFMCLQHMIHNVWYAYLVFHLQIEMYIENVSVYKVEDNITIEDLISSAILTHHQQLIYSYTWQVGFISKWWNGVLFCSLIGLQALTSNDSIRNSYIVIKIWPQESLILVLEVISPMKAHLYILGEMLEVTQIVTSTLLPTV